VKVLADALRRLGAGVAESRRRPGLAGNGRFENPANVAAGSAPSMSRDKEVDMRGAFRRPQQVVEA